MMDLLVMSMERNHHNSKWTDEIVHREKRLQDSIGIGGMLEYLIDFIDT
jgi:hypothetical protein